MTLIERVRTGHGTHLFLFQVTNKKYSKFRKWFMRVHLSKYYYAVEAKNIGPHVRVEFYGPYLAIDVKKICDIIEFHVRENVTIQDAIYAVEKIYKVDQHNHDVSLEEFLFDEGIGINKPED